MKTTNLLFILLFLSFSLPGLSQKLKDKRIGYHYVSLPSEKLPDDFQTYSVRVYGSAVRQGGLSAERLANSINMDGFKKLDGFGTNYGHLRVSVYTGYVSTGRAELKNSKSTKKDKKTGKETTTYSYWYEVPLSSNGSFKIVDPDGNILDEGSTSSGNTVSTRKYSKSSDLRKNYSSLISGLRKDFAKKAANSAVNAAQRSLNNKFAYDYRTDFQNTFFLKKHDSAKDFVKYFELTKTAFATMKGDHSAETVEAVKKKLQPAMDFWKEQGDFDPKGDKKQKRVFRAANFNIALVSYYLDDLDTAKKYAEMVLKSEKKDRRSSDMIAAVEKMKKKMEYHGINSMHYVRDLSNAKAPAKVKAFEEEKEELESANNSLSGSITINGEEIKGSVMQAKDAEEMIFGEKGNTKFTVETDGKIKEYDLTAEEISAFKLGERKFIKTRFSPSAKGESEAVMSILEEIYSSDKITMYKYYSSSGVMADEKTEFAYQKAGEDFPLSLYDTRFLLWKKGIAKYFEDCGDLKDMCAEGGIKMNKDDLIKAARIYSELCE